MTEFIMQNVGKIVTMIFSSFFAYILKEIVKMKKIHKANTEGTKALLANEITKSYKTCKEKGYCSLDEKKIIFDMWVQYKKLGGNGLLTKMIDDIMNIKEK